MKGKRANIIFLCVLGIGILCLSTVKESEIRPLYWTPPPVLKHFSLGYEDFWAHLLWLRLIQSADFCSFEKGRPVYKGDINKCEMGWSYSMSNLITDLAPRFKAPYMFSTVILGVFTGDKTGAEHILLKALKNFPKDWQVNFYATWFYSTEVNHPEKARHYALQSAQNGGPSWLYDFSNRPVEKAQQVSEKVQQELLKRNLTKEQKQYVHRKWQINQMSSKYHDASSH